LTTDLKTMTQAVWDTLSASERERLRDLSGLTPQLIGLERQRVEALTIYGETRRFIVGRSTGWRPCHLEIARRGDSGGPAAEANYAEVRLLPLGNRS
jgi:hypothetical protein